MNFLSSLFRGHKFDSVHSAVENVSAILMRKNLFRKKTGVTNRMNRICRLEVLERRELLAVDPTITLGGVILEQNEDVEQGDRFYLSWVSDVSDPSLALQEVTFELGYQDGWSYAFFDTTSDPPNGGNYDTGNDMFVVSPYSDITEDDFDYYFTHEDGHTDKVGNGAVSLTVTFSNDVFTTGKKLVFEVDVDFVNIKVGGTMSNPTYEYYSTSNFEGKDMEAAGVNFTAKFTGDQYEDLETVLDYKDIYDVGGRLDIVEDISDDPFTDGGLLTSGVVETFTLIPKPADISGYVYADVVWDCYYKPADADYALAGVEMTLYYQTEDGSFAEYCVGGKAVSTLTDADGYYEFTGLLPGTYQVHCEGNIPYGEIYGEEIAYYDKCARSQNNPVSSDPLVLTIEELVGGSSSIQNNFGKVLWGTIAGNVYEDRNLSGEFDPGDAGIAGVTIELYRMVDGEYLIERSTLTDADGSYHFNNLTYNIDPLTGKYDLNTVYAIHEVQPAEYIDAENNVGYLRETGETSGQLVKDTSYSADSRLFETISIPCFMNGVEYNFGEMKPFSVSGYVYDDLDDSGVMSSGDGRIANVTIELYKQTGSAFTRVAQTNTDSTGYYKFTDLPLGEVYYIHEVQPSAYLNAENNIGTISGRVYGIIETLTQFSDDSRLFKIDLSARSGYGWDEEGIQYNFGEVDPTITLGSAILEQNEDVEMGDRFYLSWVTDAPDPSVALQEVTFELGFEDGWAYAFFDTTSDLPNGGNYDTGHDEFAVSPYSDITEDDFDYYFTYEDGHTDKIGNGAASLTITFLNNVFTTGKKLVFEVDVDFVNIKVGGTMSDPTFEYYATSNFEGKDMEAAGVNFTAKFTGEQYEDFETVLNYKDVYSVDGQLEIVEDISDDPFTDGGLLTSGVIETAALTPKSTVITERLDIPEIITGNKGIFVSYGANSHIIEWNAVKNGGEYELQYSYDGQNWKEVKSDTTSTVIRGLTYGSGVQYRVRALANAGYETSEWSSLKTFSVCPVDIDGDGDIAATDRSWLSLSWLTSEGDEGFEYFNDINGDGDISGLDRSFLSNNWLKTVGVDDMVYPRPVSSNADFLFEELGNFESGNIEDLVDDRF